MVKTHLRRRCHRACPPFLWAGLLAPGLKLGLKRGLILLGLILGIIMVWELCPSGLALAQSGKNEGIESLRAPRPATPPRIENTEEATESRQLRRKRRRRNEIIAEEAAAEPSTEEQRDRKLLNEALKGRPRRLMIEVSLIGSSLSTSGERQGYTSEPTSHFNVAWRHDQGSEVSKQARAEFFYGFRIAPFFGTGYYRTIPGAYGFTYFGPMIGVGKIDPVPEDVGSGRTRAKASEILDDWPATNGWLLTGGLAAQSRIGNADGFQAEDVEGEFDSRGVTFDAPGLWAEARYLRLYYGALGFNLLAGAQTGREKIFFYGGLGASGWY